MILMSPFQLQIFCDSIGMSILEPYVLSFHITACWYLAIHWPSKTGIMFVLRRDLKIALREVLCYFF